MRSLREQLGKAFGATSLRDSATGEMPVTRIAAFGAAQVRRSDGGQSAPRTLGGYLWRLKWGHDRAALKPAALLVAKQVAKRAGARHWQGTGELWQRFALQAIDEWANERCAACHGRGRVVNRVRGAQPFVVARNAAMRICNRCRGTGQRRATALERAQALGVTLEVYEKHWPDRFAQLVTQLAEFEASLARPLQTQLERGNVRAEEKQVPTHGAHLRETPEQVVG